MDQTATDVRHIERINPPHRLLMAPGPTTVDPRILSAMATPTVGQFDPYMLKIMGEVQDMLRYTFKAPGYEALMVDGSSRAAIECALVSIIATGDKVLVCSAGRFGSLLAEIATRVGGDVTVITKEWGHVFELAEIKAAIDEVQPKLVCTVAGDTSTTMLQPLEGLGDICHAAGDFLMTDATASFAGNDLRCAEWGIDIATAGMQKCMGGPAGISPIVVSPEAFKAMVARKSIEEGIADSPEDVLPVEKRIRSNYFDFPQLVDYWGPRRINHHTEATHMLYAAHETLRLICEEGIDEDIERHRLNGAAMAAGVVGMGLELYGDQSTRMNDVIGIVIPEGTTDAVRAALLENYAVEIASSFGPLKGRIWRVGVMGCNARKDCIMTTLLALGSALLDAGVQVDITAGVAAAEAVYAA